MAPQKKHVGEILIDRGVITREQLEVALKRQQEKGGKLGSILVRLGFASEEEIGEALSQQMDVPHIRLRPADIDSTAVSIIPEDTARKYNLIPVSIEGSQLVVAMDDPLNAIALDVLKFTSGMEIEPVLAPKSKIRSAIEAFYAKKKLSEGQIQRYIDDRLNLYEEQELSDQKLRYQAKLAVSVKAANMIMIESIKRNATDIHVEIDGNFVRVRYRVDGYLKETFIISADHYLGIINRFKILAELELGRRNIPQEGSFRVEYDGRDVDFLVTVIPTVRGENLSIHILTQDIDLYDINRLGLSDETLSKILSCAKDLKGLLVVTGPTGSGKTTTLYSILRSVNTVGRKIITIEDPVAYRFPLMNQVSVKPSKGLDYEEALRSALRTDAEVILVQELVNERVAEMCIRAGLSGRLVLTSCNVSGAAELPKFLADMGIEPYLVSGTIDLVIGQRLVRRLCKACRQEVNFKLWGRKIKAYRAVGCGECKNTGYRGRIGIFELLPGDIISEQVSKGITAPEKLRIAAREAGFRTLWEEGILKVSNGVTSISELRRALPVDYSRYVLSTRNTKED